MEERITSRKNPFLQQVRKLLSSRKAREEAGLFVSDGTKLLQEAVKYFPGLTAVILSASTPSERITVSRPGNHRTASWSSLVPSAAKSPASSRAFREDSSFFTC